MTSRRIEAVRRRMIRETETALERGLRRSCFRRIAAVRSAAVGKVIVGSRTEEARDRVGAFGVAEDGAVPALPSVER